MVGQRGESGNGAAVSACAWGSNDEPENAYTAALSALAGSHEEG